MSDKPISVGDLVQVVRGHSCELGEVGRVEALQTWRWWSCAHCGEGEYGSVFAAKVGTDPADGVATGYPVSWLKRIPPLEELEGEHTEEYLVTSK